MPLYYQKCSKCSKVVKRICILSELNTICSCGGRLVRTPKPVSFTVKEVLDNGIQPRQLERYSDAEEVFKNLDKRDKE